MTTFQQTLTKRHMFNHFKVRNNEELNKSKDFRIALRTICKSRKEKFIAWKSHKNGIILITDIAHVTFNWSRGEFHPIIDSIIYKF